MLNALKGKNELEAGEGEGPGGCSWLWWEPEGGWSLSALLQKWGLPGPGPQTPLCALSGQPFCLNPGFLTHKVGGGLV